MSVGDRDEPCPRCGALAARDLVDGATECVTCGYVTPDRFLVAKRSLDVTSDADSTEVAR